MTHLQYFFYQLPGNPYGLDAPNKVILSGVPIDDQPNINNPFGFETTFQLDERSQNLIGQKTVAVSFADLVEDCPEVPMPKPRLKKPIPIPPVSFPKPELEQLRFNFG